MQKIKYSYAYNILEILKMAVVKIIELIGSSPKNWEDATKNALAEASLTIKNIKSLYVKSCKAKVENNKITEYRAVVKIAFVVQREK
jgi:flavin-binding protein dodecin